MPVKKTAKVPNPRFAVARAHPWLTWGSVASILTVLTMLCGFGVWIFNNVESTSSAEKREARLRAEFRAEDEKLRQEAARRVVDSVRLAAWGSVSTKRLEVLVLRNRVNDCRQAKLQSSLERAACKQYEDEFSEATDAYKRMQNEAINASRVTP